MLHPDRVPLPSRRQLLAMALASALPACAQQPGHAPPPTPGGPGPATAGQAGSGRRVTLLAYRGGSGQLATDADTTRAAVARMQAVLAQQGLQVMQPPATILAELAALPAATMPPLSIEPGAGAVIVLALRSQEWARQDETLVRVEIDAELRIGSTIAATVASGDARGQALATQPGSVGKEAALRQASANAAAAAARLLGPKLLALSDADISAMERPIGVVDGNGQVRIHLRPAPPVAAPALPQDLPRPGRIRALLVAVSDYAAINQRLGGRMTLRSLPGVKADLLALKAMLRSRGAAAADVQVLQDADATSRNVQAALRAWVRTSQPDDLVLIAFAAHGAPAQHTLSGYGMPVLSDFQIDPDPTALDFFAIQALAGALPVGQIVLIVDTCHAGGVGKHMPRLRLPASRGLARIDSGTVAPEPQRLLDSQPAASDRHFLVLSAAGSDELSLEHHPTGGLFTQLLTQAVVRAEGRQSLADVFASQVQRQVLEQSRPICRSLGHCTEQNAALAFSGRGDLIRL